MRKIEINGKVFKILPQETGCTCERCYFEHKDKHNCHLLFDTCGDILNEKPFMIFKLSKIDAIKRFFKNWWKFISETEDATEEELKDPGYSQGRYRNYGRSN